MGFGNDDDIKLKVTLEGQQEAEAQSKRLYSTLQSQIKETSALFSKAAKSFGDGFREGAAEGDKLKKAVKGVGEEAKKAGDTSKSSFSQFQSQLISLNQGLGLLERGFRGITNLAQEAGKISAVSAAFQNLQASVGSLPTENLEKLRAATGGLISDLDLMQKSNQAVLLGLPTQGFDQMAGAAIKLGRAMGIDALQAVDSLTLGVGRQSKLILDNLGIIVSAEQAQDRYAAANGKTVSALTDSEKQAAFTAEAFRKITERADELPDVQDDAATSATRLGTELQNMGGEMLAALNKNEELIASLAKLRDLAKEMAPAAGAISSAIAVIGKAGLDLADESANVIADYVGKIPGVQAAASKALGITTEGMKALVEEQKKQAFLDEVFGTKQQVQERQAALAGAARQALLKKEQQAQESLQKAEEERAKKAKDAASAAKQAARDRVAAAEKERSELKSFGRAVDDAFDLTVPQRFVDLLERAFRENIGQSTRLAEEIKKIGAEAQKAGVPLDALRGKVQAAGAPTEVPSLLGEFSKEDAIKPPSGGFLSSLFGIDTSLSSQLPDSFSELSDQLGAQVAASLGSSLSNAVSTAFQAAADGVTAEDAAPLGQSIGTALGAAIGAALGGPEGALVGAQAGGIAGQLAGMVSTMFDNTTAGNRARKEADKFFADLFDENRLSAIVGEKITRISDLVFRGDTLFGGLSDFGLGTFDDAFTKLPEAAQAAFNGVGTAFEELLGVSSEISGQIGAVIFNNIGGSLENLQILVQTTGKGFQELGDAIFNSFFDGTISLNQLLSGLGTLSDLFTAGIPGQIGAVGEAIHNFQVALADGRGSRVLLDSLRDIGAEAQEIGQHSLPALAQTIANAMGFGADRVTLFLEAMKVAGINSIEDLVNASNSKLAALAGNIQQVTQGATPTNAPVVDPTAGFTPATNFADAQFPKQSSSGGSKGISDAERKAKQAEEERKRRLKALQDETYKLVTASSQYKDVLDGLSQGVINNIQAGKQIKALYDEEFTATKKLRDAEEEYQKALAKGTAPKKLAELAQALQEAQKAVDDFKNTTDEVDLSVFKDLKGDLTLFGLAADEAGVKFDDLAKSIENAFKAGKLTASDAKKQLEQTKDILSGGIAGETGAVKKAFENILSAGPKGGAVLLNAIKGVGVETQERFLAGLNPQRAAEFQGLTKGVDDANSALQGALADGRSADEVDKLKDKLQGAKKALSDFQDTIPAVQLSDLKGYLSEAFDPGTVSKFMEALRQNGIETVNDLTNASEETRTFIAGSLQDLGLPFQETSSQVQDLLNKLDQLDKNTYKPKVELQVTSNFGDAVTQGIVQQVIDQGGGIGNFTGLGLNPTGPATTNGGGRGKLTADQRADFTSLRQKTKAGKKLSSDEKDRLKLYNTLRGG